MLRTLQMHPQGLREAENRRGKVQGPTRRRAWAVGANTSISEAYKVPAQYTYMEESLIASSSGVAVLGKVVTL